MIWKIDIFYDEEVQNLIDSFAKCFNIRFTIFTAGIEDMIVSFPYDLSPFCKLVRKGLRLNQRCLNQNLQMCRRCEQNHGKDPLIYHCHAGLHEAVMPIIVEQKTIGYAMIGQFKMYREDGGQMECIPAEIITQCGETGLEEAVLQKAYSELPVFDKEAMKNMVNLFSVITNFIVMRGYINTYQPGLAEKVSHWLDGNISGPVSIDQAARAVSRSASTVSHAIKHRFDMSFKQLCALKRVERFENFVSAEPNITITEAALHVGFEDPLYFSRLYKKIRRIPPSVFLKSKRNAPP